jgi:hypothetical protein
MLIPHYTAAWSMWARGTPALTHFERALDTLEGNVTSELLFLTARRFNSITPTASGSSPDPPGDLKPLKLQFGFPLA